MTAICRQPFAPIDGARLQSLSEFKNIQNSIPTVTSLSKRKVADLGDHVDVALGIPKRQKYLPEYLVTALGKRTLNDFYNGNGVEKSRETRARASLSKRSRIKSDSLDKGLPRASACYTQHVKSIPTLCTKHGVATSGHSKTIAQLNARRILSAKSPRSGNKLASGLAKTFSSPSVAPAGRSPPRRHGATRIEQPTTNPVSGGFSIDAALKGSIPAIRKAKRKVPESWSFEIYEDTPAQVLDNDLRDITSKLDISSDERRRTKMRKTIGKENIPPPGYISPTPRVHTTAGQGSMMDLDQPRVVLGDLDVQDFYGEGVNASDVFIVPGDDDDGILYDGAIPLEELSSLAEMFFAPGFQGFEFEVLEEAAPGIPI